MRIIFRKGFKELKEGSDEVPFLWLALPLPKLRFSNLNVSSKTAFQNKKGGEVFSSRIILCACTTLIMFSNEQSDLHVYLSSVQELCIVSKIYFGWEPVPWMSAIYDICLFFLLPFPWALGRRFTFSPLLPPRLKMPRCLREGLLLISYGRTAP